MVERRPTLGILAHLVLILGVAVVAFPLYVTFVASTQTAQEILQSPMSLVPGRHLVDNYLAALQGTGMGAASNAPVGRMMMVSLISALVIALGKIAISLLSPTTFFLFVINVVYAFFDTFAIVDAATQGGPGKDTAILVYKVYYDGFKALDLGSSAAQSVVLMVIVIALTVVQFRFVEKKVNY